MSELKPCPFCGCSVSVNKMSKQRLVSDSIEIDIDDYKTAKEFIGALNAAFDSLTDEQKETAEITARQKYEDCIYISIWFGRPETEEEKARGIEQEERNLEYKRQQYLKLKAQFEGGE